MATDLTHRLAKVALVQRNIPHYRFPLFRMLARDSRYQWVFFAGQHGGKGTGGLPVGDFTGIDHVTIDNRRIRNHCIWQRGISLDWTFQALVFEMTFPILSNPWLICKARRHGIRLIGWNKGIPEDGKPRAAWKTAYIRFIMNRCDALISYGRTSTDFFTALDYPRERIFAAQNTVDLEAIAQAAEQNRRLADDLRRRFGFPPETVIAGFLGRLSPEKQVDKILRAFGCAVKLGLENAHLVIAGEGPERRKLEALAIELGIADEVLFVTDVPEGEEDAFFQLLDLSLSFSVAGLGIIRSMANGTPVLSTPEKRPETEFLVDGETAFVTEGFSVQEFGERMKTALRQRPSLMAIGHKAGAAVLRHAPLSGMAQAFDDAVDFCLRGPPERKACHPDVPDPSGAANAETGRGRRIWFAFATADWFTGQRIATELVIRAVRERAYATGIIKSPAWQRNGWLSALPAYLTSLAKAWWQYFAVARDPGAILHVTLGQSPIAFVRDGIPSYLCAKVFLKPMVVSLNGGLFMNWPDSSFTNRLFMRLLSGATVVSVVGANQRRRLLDQGLAPARVAIVPNSCEFDPMVAEELERKLFKPADRPVRILFLSTLISSKGYPEYLEALSLLGKRPGCQVEATLCGRVIASPFEDKFETIGDARCWIEEKIDEINQSGRVKATWIEGAAGMSKRRLYEEADVFVLPSRYPLEAQPLVLLEAMSQGCAIVTTDVAEIPHILSATEAIFLGAPAAEMIATVVELLVSNPSRRAELGRAGWLRFLNEFSPASYSERWLEVFDQVSKGSAVKDEQPGVECPTGEGGKQ